jgi:UDP-N-acetyl-D-glucosamine/UDP-N-acetyl-D-galactosamine dehydrogenase
MPPTFQSLTTQLEAHKTPIAIIGLGYVGLPLAVEFARKYKVIGFDIKDTRITQLQSGTDSTREVSAEDLESVRDNLQLTSQPEDLAKARVYIVTVPTPIDNARRPDLRPLLSASKTVGKVLKPGDTVIYESTVYPGCTEEDCAPILEAECPT